jgi:hypothetical protein
MTHLPAQQQLNSKNPPLVSMNAEAHGYMGFSTYVCMNIGILEHARLPKIVEQSLVNTSPHSLCLTDLAKFVALPSTFLAQRSCTPQEDAQARRAMHRPQLLETREMSRFSRVIFSMGRKDPKSFLLHLKQLHSAFPLLRVMVRGLSCQMTGYFVSSLC